jgi:hypothetical protein
MAIVLTNFGKTTLNGAHNNSTTSIAVTSGAVFPSTGDFYIRIDDEIMKVTSRSTNTLTVVRAADGSSAASHADLADVKEVAAAEFFKRLGSVIVPAGAHASRATAATANEGQVYVPNDLGAVSVARSTGSLWVPYGPIYPFTAPDNAGFSWANQGGAAVTALLDYINLNGPAQASGSFSYRVRYKTAPATPWKLTVFCLHDIYSSIAFLKCGLVFRQSSDGKLEVFEWEGGSTLMTLRVNKMASPTSNAGGGVYASDTTVSTTFMNWMRIQDDGTNRIYEVSCNGRDWKRPFAPQTRTTFLTADQFGFCVDAANNSGVAQHDVNMSVLSWLES